MTNNLPKSAAQISFEADKASAEAFKAQYGMPIETVPVIANPEPSSTNFINKPVLSPAKSEAEFLDEFFEETGYHKIDEVGKIATDNVVEVDFSESTQEQDGVA